MSMPDRIAEVIKNKVIFYMDLITRVMLRVYREAGDTF